jgi:hypothetical protein
MKRGGYKRYSVAGEKLIYNSRKNKKNTRNKLTIKSIINDIFFNNKKSLKASSTSKNTMRKKRKKHKRRFTKKNFSI